MKIVKIAKTYKIAILINKIMNVHRLKFYEKMFTTLRRIFKKMNKMKIN